MRPVYRTTVLGLAALAFVASACSGTPLSDIQNKQLSVSVVGISPAELTATLDLSNGEPYPCSLSDDAFARLNGQPVPLFLGEAYTIPPMGDDGGQGCHPPSVTLNPIPSDPPWTLEIGDDSEIVSATFGPETETYQVGPPLTAVLTSSQDTLIVQISGGDLTQVTSIKATMTASNGQYTERSGTLVGSTVEFAYAVATRWPPGPVAVKIDLSYVETEQLLGCQNATCSLASTSAAPGSAGTVWMTTTFTVPLVCTPVNGVCS
jgi:hypothetical protein